jgi:hypothetical protein
MPCRYTLLSTAAGSLKPGCPYSRMDCFGASASIPASSAATRPSAVQSRPRLRPSRHPCHRAPQSRSCQAPASGRSMHRRLRAKDPEPASAMVFGALDWRRSAVSWVFGSVAATGIGEGVSGAATGAAIASSSFLRWPNDATPMSLRSSLVSRLIFGSFE